MDPLPAFAPASLSAPLLYHPASPPAAVGAVRVDLAWRADGALALDYLLCGAIGRVRLPSAARPAPADRLWAHTCCELFVAPRGEAGYREFNFSPSGQWAAYGFSAYRQRSPGNGHSAPPRIALARTEESLTLSILIPADALATPRGAAVQLGLSVVVEEEDGALAYWALRHPGLRPDFHHRDAFALEFTHSAP